MPDQSIRRQFCGRKHCLNSCVLAALEGDFYFFSRRRLEAIAREVQCHCVSDAQLDFFQGITPWTLTKPKRPYIALSDCTFRDYIDIFHRRDYFRSDDLIRIEQAEGAWLRNARRVLFTSDWAAERAAQYYALDENRVSSVGIFGEIDLPPHDTYADGKEFAFVATNFEAKGGRTVLAAFRELRKRHADATSNCRWREAIRSCSRARSEFCWILTKGDSRRICALSSRFSVVSVRSYIRHGAILLR